MVPIPVRMATIKKQEITRQFKENKIHLGGGVVKEGGKKRSIYKLEFKMINI